MKTIPCGKPAAGDLLLFIGEKLGMYKDFGRLLIVTGSDPEQIWNSTMMQPEIGIRPAESLRDAQATLAAKQTLIVETSQSPAYPPGLEVSGQQTSLQYRDLARVAEAEPTTREHAKAIRFAPGWPDSPQVQTLASIVQEVLAATDDIPPEEDFTAMLLQKLEEAGLDITAPIVDFYA